MNLKGASIVIFLVAQAFPAICQFKNRMLYESGSEPQTALSIAINPKSPNNIVAVYGPDIVFVTKDGGASWQQSKITSPRGVQGNPLLLTDEKGNFHYVHASAPANSGGDGSAQTGRMVIQRSGDGGITWSQAEGVGNDLTRHQKDPWAAVDGKGNLYVTWTAEDSKEDACKRSILFSTSRNGKKWTDPAVITQHEGDCSGGALRGIPAVTHDGKLMVAWASDNKIFLDRSFNGGEWWLSNDILVSESNVGPTQSISGFGKGEMMPVLIADNSKTHYRGSLYIVWADQRNGDSDIWFTRSHNFGDNWSLPAQVGSDGGGKHQYMPWITVDPSTGYVYVLYYDRRGYDDDRTDVYLAWSRDGGGSFQNIKISEEPFLPREDLSAPVYNSISAHKGIIVPIWSRVDDGKVSVWTATIRQEELEKKP